MFWFNSLISILLYLSPATTCPPADTVVDDDHFYIELNGTETDSYNFSFGTVKYDQHFSPDKVEYETADIEEGMNSLLRGISSRLATLPADKQNVLIYIHGMWAHQPQYWSAHTQKMRKGIFNNDENPYGVVVSLIWECGLNYMSNVPLAYDKGKRFTPLVIKLIEATQEVEGAKLSILGHSMGNRVLQGFYENLQGVYKDPPIHNIVMAGADLESNIFEKNQPLHHIDRFAEQVVIYVHNNDRSLKMSKLLNDNDRLGLQGVRDFSLVSDIISTVDVSIVTDNETLSSKMSNHRYFCESATVRRDILNCLCENEENISTTRKQLKNERSYMLLFDETSSTK